ncbi:MAG: hypothetical protein CMC89_02790 [Flavobacteriaceae bacterium]|nr:hypothetical protein [Flavobacteriaceae bacterium]|tara:strand:- start:8528 stop:8869 length:342 start_codon:yes stop_codon:yes gene_type:complete
MHDKQEKLADNLRAAGKMVRQAQIQIHTAEATLKREIAIQKVIASEQRNLKSNAAQDRWADEQESVFNARIDLGVAKGNLEAARCEVMAVEAEFKIWQSKQADLRFERRVYGG